MIVCPDKLKPGVIERAFSVKINRKKQESVAKRMRTGMPDYADLSKKGQQKMKKQVMASLGLDSDGEEDEDSEEEDDRKPAAVPEVSTGRGRGRGSGKLRGILKTKAKKSGKGGPFILLFEAMVLSSDSP